jgi:hypothetical protein
MAAKPSSPSDESATLAHFTGTVSRVLVHPNGAWAEIIIDGADDLYREIRLPSPLQNEDGTVTRLKEGDRVNLTVALAATPKSPERN